VKPRSGTTRIAARFADPRNLSKAIGEQKGRERTQLEYEPRSTPAEQGIAAIWAKLLSLHKISRNDNFFQMGGHSLLQTQMLARVRDAYEIERPLRALFESPVLRSFAEKVESSRNSATTIERLTPQHRGETAPLSFAQQGLWFLDQLVSLQALKSSRRRRDARR
jgi:Phosphopantetheine attachment site